MINRKTRRGGRASSTSTAEQRPREAITHWDTWRTLMNKTEPSGRQAHRTARELAALCERAHVSPRGLHEDTALWHHPHAMAPHTRIWFSTPPTALTPVLAYTAAVLAKIV